MGIRKDMQGSYKVCKACMRFRDNPRPSTLRVENPMDEKWNLKWKLDLYMSYSLNSPYAPE